MTSVSKCSYSSRQLEHSNNSESKIQVRHIDLHDLHDLETQETVAVYNPSAKPEGSMAMASRVSNSKTSQMLMRLTYLDCMATQVNNSIYICQIFNIMAEVSNIILPKLFINNDTDTDFADAIDKGLSENC